MRKHPLDFASLVFGLVIIAIAATVVVDRTTDVHVDLRLAVPIGFVTLGVLGLLGSVVGQRRSTRLADEQRQARPEG